VHVRADAMVMISALTVGIDVHRHAAQMRQVMQELVAYRLRDLVTFMHLERAQDRDAEIGMEAMSDPPRSHVRDFGDARHVPCGVRDVVKRLGLHAVERS
jgi:hypothetical protein